MVQLTVYLVTDPWNKPISELFLEEADAKDFEKIYNIHRDQGYKCKVNKVALTYKGGDPVTEVCFKALAGDAQAVDAVKDVLKG